MANRQVGIPPCDLDPDDAIQCECGHESDLGGYVAAHWDVELVFTCEDCGKRYSVLQGHVERIK